MCIQNNNNSNNNILHNHRQIDKQKEYNILSWNCRGISNKKQELMILINELLPYCIGIQETKLKASLDFCLTKYNFEHKVQNIVDGENAKGGVGIFVRRDVPYLLVNLNTDLQAIAVQVNLHRKFTFCSIYISPTEERPTQVELQNLINQLPAPFILMGDMNAHNTLWYDNKIDREGQIIENIILENNLLLLDGNKFTFCRGASRSHIDLTLVSPELAADFEWDTYDDQCSSDHVPVILKTKNKFSVEGRPKWNFDKADWEKYRNLATLNEDVKNFSDIDDLTSYITDVIIQAANRSIPKTRPIKGKLSVPWWNGCCRVKVKGKNQR